MNDRLLHRRRRRTRQNFELTGLGESDVGGSDQSLPAMKASLKILAERAHRPLIHFIGKRRIPQGQL